MRVRPSASHHAKTNRILSRMRSCHIINDCDRTVKLRVILTMVDKKTDCFNVDGVCNLCNTVSEDLGCHFYYFLCQEAQPFLSDADIEKGVRKWDQDKMRRDNIRQRKFQIVEMWECELWNLFETDASVKSHLRENFSYKRPLNEEKLLQKIIEGKFFGYVQCDIEVPQRVQRHYSKFPPIFKNTVVSREDIGTSINEYAEKENIMAQLRITLISSLHLTDGTLISPLLLF